MKNIVALRVEQKLYWNDDRKDYEASEWRLVYLNEGETSWREIPILTLHVGGPLDKQTYLSDKTVSQTKEK